MKNRSDSYMHMQAVLRTCVVVCACVTTKEIWVQDCFCFQTDDNDINIILYHDDQWNDLDNLLKMVSPAVAQASCPDPPTPRREDSI